LEGEKPQTMNTNGSPSGGSFRFTAPVISPDGRFVAFDSMANDFVPDDFHGASDIFLRDVEAGVTELITKAAPALPAKTAPAHSLLTLNSLSANGRFVVSTRYDELPRRATPMRGLMCSSPKNAGSIFRVLSVAAAGGGGRQVIWSGNPQRNYRVEYKDDLNSPTWTALTGTISWNGNTASIVDATGGANPNRFYRAVRLP